MDNKYLIIITLIDGQNFTVPNGASDKIEAMVFAEARFGNESVLRSDPIKLTNSNPEFVTELAWQLDKKSLHQLRVERKAIKLQVFMQTKERKRHVRHINGGDPNTGTDHDETHKVELIGYTILDLRSAQQRDQPKFKWCPLLNPKFRKPSYNRPEIQLAITLNCLNEESNQDSSNQFSSISSLPDGENGDESLESENNVNGTNQNATSSSADQNLYTTCLDITTNNGSVLNDEIIDNDIIIRPKDGVFYLYDAKNPHKSRLEDCDELYELTITVPFGTGLNLLVDATEKDEYYFSTHLFGSNFRTQYFSDLITVEPKDMVIHVQTTHPAALATYFELNSNVDIKFHKRDGEVVAMSTIQLNQLCSLDLKCRSIEGLFLLQPINESKQDTKIKTDASIGVSVVLERVKSFTPVNSDTNRKQIAPLKSGTESNFASDRSILCPETTHQLTMEDTHLYPPEEEDLINLDTSHEILVKDHDGPGHDDHHYCFTIDLKKFCYTPSQRLIPTLRELIIRYSYPFFGYKDTITTDTSIPINATSSIIVSGFCEFNFATTSGPLLTALTELPLNLEILALEKVERIVATSGVNLAKALKLTSSNIDQLKDNSLSNSSSVPIYALDGEEIGQLQLYLCLKDLGKPSRKFTASIDNLQDGFDNLAHDPIDLVESSSSTNETLKLDNFLSETKKHIDLWKEEYFEKLADEIRRRDNDRFKRLYQRIEAKETRRDQEFKRQLDEMVNLEAKFKKSLACVEGLEKMLSESLEHIKAKNALVDNRLNVIEAKLAQSSSNGMPQQPSTSRRGLQPQSSLDDNIFNNKDDKSSATSIPSIASDKISARRSSLKTATSNTGLTIPARSTSLVRRPADDSNVTRIIRRPGCVVATVINNGLNTRVRSNSAKLNLSKETQERLMNLRKEKAELLKRGCRPNDELIREINSLIEKLAF